MIRIPKEDLLYERELRRRSAFGNSRLAHDSATRKAALRELREIQKLDKTDPLIEDPMSLNEVRKSVPIHPAEVTFPYVLSEEMPEPWRSRFWAASAHGITVCGPGFYAHDWQNFLDLWQAEHLDLADKLLDMDDEL